MDQHAAGPADQNKDPRYDNERSTTRWSLGLGALAAGLLADPTLQ